MAETLEEKKCSQLNKIEGKRRKEMHGEEKERSPSPSFLGHRGRGGNKSPERASERAYPSRPPFGFGGESFRAPARCFRDLSQSTATHIHHTQIIMVVKQGVEATRTGLCSATDVRSIPEKPATFPQYSPCKKEVP